MTPLLRRQPRPDPQAQQVVDVTRIALSFITSINDHDVDALSSLITDDHRFIDGLGAIVEGRDRIAQSWIEYFRWFPDYHIKVETSLSRVNEVAFFGSASGTFAPDQDLVKTNSWEIPAAFRATIRGDKIAEWRVYADNQPARRIMGRAFP